VASVTLSASPGCTHPGWVVPSRGLKFLKPLPRLSTVLLRRNVQKSIVELSPRELDVVRLIAQGLSNKEIGVRLHLSDKTVKDWFSRRFH
jgi:DNA-binding NarL/FixJ family response regulator